MHLICGLGNPGKKFRKARHNLGRLIVSNWRIAVNFPDFEFEKKFNALISRRVFDKKKIILALPEIFMNLSGKSVKILTKTYNLKSNNLIVIHDDIDIPLGKIKIVKNRGAAGHKGLESIIKALNSKDFVRLRIGIQPEAGKLKNVEKFVLEKFNKTEEKIVQRVIKKSCLVIAMILKEGLEKAMAKYN